MANGLLRRSSFEWSDKPMPELDTNCHNGISDDVCGCCYDCDWGYGSVDGNGNQINKC